MGNVFILLLLLMGAKRLGSPERRRLSWPWTMRCTSADKPQLEGVTSRGRSLRKVWRCGKVSILGAGEARAAGWEQISRGLVPPKTWMLY